MIDSTLKNANILIVDDQQANIDILVGLLEFKGFTNVKTTTDPRLAVSLFEEFKPDLLLLDLKMPHVSGFEIMEKLKTVIPSNTYFPILILTADITQESKEKSLLSGASDFLSKPFDLKEVELRINNLLKVSFFQQQLENQNQILDEQNKFSENLINTIREPLLALDQEFKVVKASLSFYDFFKVSFEETIGTLIYDLGNRQWNIPKLRELLETILPEKTTFNNYEVEHDFSTIGKRIVLLNARQIKRVLGKKKIILLAFEDITERKKAELFIQKQNKQLQELNAAKDKYFSIIAHDLKSPFQGFIGLTELMGEEISSFSVAQLSTYIQSINSTARNLYKLLSNLLEWSLMQKGVLSFNPVEIALSEVVSQNIDIIIKRGEQKGIKLILDVAHNQKVWADEAMLNSILRNLLSNSVKFTSRGGEVIVSAKETENNIVEISIRDTGTGMSSDLCSQLFKIEERVGQKGTEGEESTGLGLLLCKEFVEKHGGKIWVDSEEGKGSTFYFTLQERN